MGKLAADWDKLFKKEIKLGYNDAAVFGGFAAWLVNWAKEKDFPEAAVFISLAELYKKSPLASRGQILLQMQSFLEQVSPEFLAATEVPGIFDSHMKEKVIGSELATSIQYFKGVGPKRVALLKRLGIETVEDLVTYYPRTYENRGEVKKIYDLAINDTGMVRAQVIKVNSYQPNRSLHILKAILKDETGFLSAVWYNQKYLADRLKPGQELFVYGSLQYKYNQPELLVSDYEFVEKGEEVPRSAILPVYRTTESLNQKYLRSLVAAILEKYGNKIPELLPEELLVKRGLQDRKDAIFTMHGPKNMEEQETARKRLAYDELLLLQLVILGSRQPENAMGIKRKTEPKILQDFLAQLPFGLTNAQSRIIDRIFEDMDVAKPMMRLVQGDVGSGKTIVAAAALYKNFISGYQGALMVPTEILAQQHYHSLVPLWEKLGVRCALFTGFLTGKEREKLLLAIKTGEIDVVIGTHTLIQNKIKFANLGLAITDEQHRFGVMQRSELSDKGKNPDILIMTATPIPRTLALTLYGELNVSVIDQMPPGRQPVKTYAVGYDMEERISKFLRKEIDAGGQVYIVCPLVEESEKLDLQSATELAERLAKGGLAGYRVELLHGRLKSAEKDELMQKFAAGEIQALVSTTVIEIGINVPNANVMLVWDAHRFGLAQLHQLRGRVGRGSRQSFCVLMHDARTEVAKERMKIMSTTTDGYVIAEEDLRLRGAGEFLGTKQHGLSDLKVANLLKDGELLEIAREDAQVILAEPQKLILPALSQMLDKKINY